LREQRGLLGEQGLERILVDDVQLDATD